MSVIYRELRRWISLRIVAVTSLVLFLDTVSDGHCQRLDRMYCAPARNAALIICAVDNVQKNLPFQLTGLNMDNGAEFINEAIFEYCSAKCIALTR